MTIPEMKSVSFIRQDSKEVIAARIARSGFKKTPKKKPLTFPVQSGKIAVDPTPRSRIPLDSVAPFETDGVRIRIGKVWNDIPARCLLNREAIIAWAHKCVAKSRKRALKRDRKRQRRTNPQFEAKKNSRLSHLTPEYIAYITSDAWKLKRDEAFSIFGRQCNRCGGFRKLQCHHKTYFRLFNEVVATDLVVARDAMRQVIHGRPASRGVAGTIRESSTYGSNPNHE